MMAFGGSRTAGEEALLPVVAPHEVRTLRCGPRALHTCGAALRCVRELSQAACRVGCTARLAPVVRTPRAALAVRLAEESTLLPLGSGAAGKAPLHPPLRHIIPKPMMHRPDAPVLPVDGQIARAPTAKGSGQFGGARRFVRPRSAATTRPLPAGRAHNKGGHTL